MISTLAWVQRGVAKEQPDRFQMTDAEFERIQKLSEQQLGAARDDLAAAQERVEIPADEEETIPNEEEIVEEEKKSDDDDEEDAKIRAQYNLDDYDSDSDVDSDQQPDALPMESGEGAFFITGLKLTKIA